MGHSATQLFLGYFFTGNGFNYQRAGDEHLGGSFYHVDEVGQGRAVNSAACGRSHDSRNLGDNTGRNGVVEEQFAIAAQSIDSFLDTSSAGVVQANAGSAHLQGQLLNFGNLVGMHFTQGTAFNGEVLCKYINQTTIYSAVTSGYAFTRQVFFLLAEVVAAMVNEAIQFYKGTFIQQCSNSFPRGHFAIVMLFFNSLRTAGAQNHFGFFEHFLNSFLSSQVLTPP